MDKLIMEQLKDWFNKNTDYFVMSIEEIADYVRRHIKDSCQEFYVSQLIETLQELHNKQLSYAIREYGDDFHPVESEQELIDLKKELDYE